MFVFSKMPTMWNRVTRYVVLFLLAMCAVVGGAIALPQQFPATAQLPPVLIPRVPIDDATAQQIYAQLPGLPLENQYISRDTGEPATENTLVRRLIVYHLLVKGRPPFYRLDWKLTLADYLGANELMFQDAYPGADDLQTNPLAGDRAAIAALTRQQRDDLVLTLVRVYNPNYDTETTATEAGEPSEDMTSSPSSETASPSNSNNLPSLPQPGDADLLRF